MASSQDYVEDQVKNCSVILYDCHKTVNAVPMTYCKE